MASRGIPRLITSNNETNFKRASKILLKLIQTPEVQAYIANKRIPCCFLLQKAPWQGGCFESLVKRVKRTLKKILGRAFLSFEELLKVVTGIECTVNCRPITYLYSDGKIELLTPSHLISGRRVIFLPYTMEESEVGELTSPDILNKRLQCVNALLKHYWNRFKREHLLNLRKQHKCNEGGRERKPEIGEVVIVHDDNVPHQCWKLERIIEVQQSADGVIRRATVKVITKTGKVNKLRRPVQRLFPLEVLDKPAPDESDRQELEVKLELQRWPRRVAAQNADFFRRLVGI